MGSFRSGQLPLTDRKRSSFACCGMSQKCQYQMLAQPPDPATGPALRLMRGFAAASKLRSQRTHHPRTALLCAFPSLMGLLEAGHVVLRHALRILGVLRRVARVVCSSVPTWVEGRTGGGAGVARRDAPRLSSANGLIGLPEDAFASAFAQNASAEDRAVLAAVQRPISLNCITIPVGRPLWKDIPTWFLLAEEDRMIVPETQRFMAQRMKAKLRAHAVDHTPSVTAPGAVIDIVRDAIRSVTTN